jgi:hypothetical protein
MFSPDEVKESPPAPVRKLQNYRRTHGLTSQLLAEGGLDGSLRGDAAKSSSAHLFMLKWRATQTVRRKDAIFSELFWSRMKSQLPVPFSAPWPSRAVLEPDYNLVLHTTRLVQCKPMTQAPALMLKTRTDVSSTSICTQTLKR